MGRFAEEIERTAHIDLFSRPHIEQRQVHRAAAAVAGLFGNVSLGKEILLHQIGIKIRLHTHILILNPPIDKMLYRADRAIGVEHFEPQAAH